MFQPTDHVGRGAKEGVGQKVGFNTSCQPEVSKFDDAGVSEEDVVGLYIPVKDLSPVDVLEESEHLSETQWQDLKEEMEW